MKAAELVDIRQLTMVEVPRPVLSSPNQLLIQVKATGICGSEIHAFTGTHPFRKPPAIMGHEVAGVVVEVGEQVRIATPGERVFIDPQWTCGTCRQCISGHKNLCVTKKVMGIQEWPGGFGEFIVVPEETVFHLPEQLSFIQGAMLEPLSVAVHAVRKARPQKGTSVLILGTGSIGSLIAAVVKAEGINNLFTADLHEHCVHNSMEHFGAINGFILPDPDFSEIISSATGGEWIDTVFICGDDPKLLNLAINVLKFRGTICLLALMTEAPLVYDGYAVLRKEASIISSYMGVHSDSLRSLELVKTKRVDVDKIVTHRLAIEDAQVGMELALTKADGAIKVVFEY